MFDCFILLYVDVKVPKHVPVLSTTGFDWKETKVVELLINIVVLLCFMYIDGDTSAC